MKVFVLTEGGTQIGFGHITRCLSLVEAFEEKKTFPVCLINGDLSIAPFLEGTRHQVIDWLSRREEVFLRLEGAGIVVIDSYLADPAFYQRIPEIAKVPVYFDDRCRLEYPRGIVVNGAVGAEKLPYPPRQDVHYLLGSRYVPLRKEFWDIPERKVRKSLKTILVTFGGSDTRRCTLRVLDVLADFDRDLAKIVVIGRGYDQVDEIKKRADGKTRFLFAPDPGRMIKGMLEADAAISAAGQTLYELARAGIPTIAVRVSDNQAVNIKGLTEAGVIDYAGSWEEPALAAEIKARLNALRAPEVRRSRIEAGRKLVGSRGAQEIVAYAKSKYFVKSIVVRKFELGDMRKIYELANEESIRQSSFNRNPIPWENHDSWFRRKLADHNSLCLVAEAHGCLVGQIRFEVQNREAVISISMDKGYRGFGLGKTMMRQALRFLKEAFPAIDIVHAQIRSENVASIKFFQSCGFVFLKDLSDAGQPAVEYLYRFIEPVHEH